MKKRIAIIGAGISGLTLAWALKNRFGESIDLSLYEKNLRPGGWIRSQVIDGFFFEQGPRSCRSKGEGTATLKLIEALNLQGEVITASPVSAKRFLYTDHKLHKVPSGLWECYSSPLMEGILSTLLGEWRRSEGIQEDESILEFMSRRFSHQMAVNLMDPLTSGIYAGDIEKLSMRSCFPKIWQMEKTHGSICKALVSNLWNRSKSNVSTSSFIKHIQKSPLFTLKNGMEAIPNELGRLLFKELHLGSAVHAIKKESTQISILLQDGKKVEADQVYLAVPAKIAAQLLRTHHSALAQPICEMQASSVGVVNLGWKKSILKQEGFGYLIPSKEKEDLLGVVWDSSAFPLQNRMNEETRLTAMIGGSHRPELLKCNEEHLIECVLNGLKKHMGIVEQPDVIHVTRAEQAIPQYEVGHQARMHLIEKMRADEMQDRLKFIGSAWRGVSVNECIAEAMHEANSM